MTSMEAIVRPFAPVIITPPARAPRTAAIASEPAVFSLGGKGGRTVSITLAADKGVVKDDKVDLKESGRDSTKVRVENEDDPEQFVEFCRADKITMSPKKKGAPTAAASHAHSTLDDAIGGNNKQMGPQKDSPTEYSYTYPPDKTCVSPNKPPKGCQ